MPTITLQTQIDAPLETCFDAARDITLHCRTARDTSERAVAGITEGLIGLGESVTFEGVHFGVRQRLMAKITEYSFPHRFVDEMTEGPFASLKHIHEFCSTERGTVMTDIVAWESPFGVVGRLADRLFVERHVRRFLNRRNSVLKAEIEGQISGAGIV